MKRLCQRLGTVMTPWWHSCAKPLAQTLVKAVVCYINRVEETNLKLVSIKGRRGDSIFAVTMLSHAAVTPLLTHNQAFNYKYVTDDSKFSLFNSLVVYAERLYLNPFPNKITITYNPENRILISQHRNSHRISRYFAQYIQPIFSFHHSLLSQK